MNFKNSRGVFRGEVREVLLMLNAISDLIECMWFLFGE